MSQIDDTILSIKIHLLPNAKEAFFNWQAIFRSQVSQVNGFKSLEILSPCSQNSDLWVLSLRFVTKNDVDLWLQSSSCEEALKELTAQNIIKSPYLISQNEALNYQSGITEVYVTLVNQEKLPEFHKWHANIHKIETTFPGFQRIYIQAPNLQKKEEAWITLLQFDTLENLEHWHDSPERAKMLEKAKDFVISNETHRLLSSFGGWFNDNSLQGNPPRWKQNMLVLAVLFPIVMLQYLYLAPYLSIPFVLKTFIQNLISVILMAWPLLPITIYALKWWLEENSNWQKNLQGIGILIGIYLLEIVLFWLLIFL